MKGHAHAVWCAIAVASTSSAEVINVPADEPTIQAGIDAALDGDEIVVAPGTWVESLDLSGKAITVRSTDPTDPDVVAITIVDGNGSGSVITCESGEGPDTVLDGFTITGGSASVGGGMFNNASSPTVSNCTFTSNSAELGGGMFNDTSSPTVSNCTFTGNLSEDSGGGVFNDFSSPMVTDCTFTGNYADGFGGGMVNWNNSDPSVTGCTFSDNGAEAGGGLFGGGGPVTNCTFTDNSAYQGGGLYGGNVVTHSTFSGNSAYQGGGIASCGTVINCTFTDNSAEYGGGMHGCGTLRDCTFSGNLAANGRAVALIDMWPWPPSELVLANCILWDSGNETWAIYGTITVSYSNVQGGYAGAGNIDVDPLFVDPAGGDLRLQPGSPCIDAGDNLAVPDGVILDLEGNPRFAHDSCTVDTGNPDGTNPPVDMGAYEFQPSCPTDLDCNGATGFGDLLAILAAWGSCTDCPEDLNGDDAVGFEELLAVLSSWGPCP